MVGGVGPEDRPQRSGWRRPASRPHQGRHVGQGGQPPLADDPLGGLGDRAEHSPDLAGLVGDRAVGEREVALLGVAVALEHEQLVGRPGGAAPAITCSSIGPMTSQISVHTSRPGAPSARGCLVSPSIGAVGVVVDHRPGPVPTTAGSGSATTGRCRRRCAGSAARSAGPPAGWPTSRWRRSARPARCRARRGTPRAQRAPSGCARTLRDGGGVPSCGSWRVTTTPQRPGARSAGCSTAWAQRHSDTSVRPRATRVRQRPEVTSAPDGAAAGSADLVGATGGPVAEHAEGVDDARGHPRPAPRHRRRPAPSSAVGSGARCRGPGRTPAGQTHHPHGGRRCQAVHPPPHDGERGQLHGRPAGRAPPRRCGARPAPPRCSCRAARPGSDHA